MHQNLNIHPSILLLFTPHIMFHVTILSKKFALIVVNNM